MGLTRAEHFALVLDRLYPGDGWAYDARRARFTNTAGLVLPIGELAGIGSGVSLKFLLDQKRDAFATQQLGNALSWLRGDDLTVTLERLLAQTPESGYDGSEVSDRGSAGPPKEHHG